ncbi:hypothetical protein AZE42_13253 [Rhizopogon vesiculosus]|uniref:Uncharacterized protein n=1 Tax=Rhizopogon vesiculosus TaxID=180088 RepID=A0A1J8QZI7_9AGAM|nr:hypothetical protein AZE42_13253 [Rhizopogon vesiculosus]
MHVPTWRSKIKPPGETLDILTSENLLARSIHHFSGCRNVESLVGNLGCRITHYVVSYILHYDKAFDDAIREYQLEEQDDVEANESGGS